MPYPFAPVGTVLTSYVRLEETRSSHELGSLVGGLLGAHETLSPLIIVEPMPQFRFRIFSRDLNQGQVQRDLQSNKCQPS